MHIVFAHGAGASSQSDWMQSWKKRLGSIAKVTTFDYPYMKAGRKTPDLQPKLEAAHRDAIASIDDDNLILAGKSMGCRIGCHVSLHPEVASRVHALVCFGYPLVGQTGKLRDEVLVALDKPILFIQGTRDRLCPLDVLERVRKRMKAPNEVHIVESGDHSLQITKSSGLVQRQVDTAILDAIQGFVARHRS